MSKNIGNKGAPKRIFLIINRYDYCNEYSSKLGVMGLSSETGSSDVTVNVAINVPVDNKKNAFFGVPFEVVI